MSSAAANISAAPHKPSPMAQGFRFFAKGANVICRMPRGEFLICTINPGWGDADALAMLLASKLTDIGVAPLSR